MASGGWSTLWKGCVCNWLLQGCSSKASPGGAATHVCLPYAASGTANLVEDTRDVTCMKPAHLSTCPHLVMHCSNVLDTQLLIYLPRREAPADGRHGDGCAVQKVCSPGCDGLCLQCTHKSMAASMRAPLAALARP